MSIVMQVFMYYKACPDDNEYAHPMDLCPVVDLNEQRVIHIDAYDTKPDIPMQAANYHRSLLTKPFRQAAKPWKVVQPEVSPVRAASTALVTCACDALQPGECVLTGAGCNVLGGSVLGSISMCLTAALSRSVLYWQSTDCFK
jgi:hypothetical protein